MNLVRIATGDALTHEGFRAQHLRVSYTNLPGNRHCETETIAGSFSSLGVGKIEDQDSELLRLFALRVSERATTLGISSL